jgi:hypothetical protein
LDVLKPRTGADSPASEHLAKYSPRNSHGPSGTHPEKLIIIEPGEWSVREEITAVAREARVPAVLPVRPNRIKSR